MASQALGALLAGLAEIKALQRANPTPQEGSGLKRPDVVRAIGRSEVVLLSSHFERYIYALNEEAVEAVCASSVRADALPERLRLQYSRSAIDVIAATSWEKRKSALVRYSIREAPLWVPDGSVDSLESSRLLEWMKAPDPRSLVRVFQIWGIDDIFSAITRLAVHRSRIRLRLEELVEKRNNIAHGDFTVEATYIDVTQYTSVVRQFCSRADGRLARRVGLMIGGRPW